MIVESVDGKQWTKTVMQKLKSFGKKCPLLIKLYTGSYKGDQGVYIECIQPNNRYFFPWKYDQDPKEFIYDIKTHLVPLYPRLIKEEYSEHKTTPDEAAEQLEKGATLKTITPVVRQHEYTDIWRIDRVIPWSQQFILKLEQRFDKDGKPVEIENAITKKYLYKGSAVIYLRNYRQQQFKTPKEASDAFFSSANLVCTLK